MVEITAALVKELRDCTGAGMMECKKALLASQGDLDAAIKLMREAGQIKAAKKADRTAAEGKVVVSLSADQKYGVIIEINCETDFVGRDQSFSQFAELVAARALENQSNNIDDLLNLPIQANDTTTIEQARLALVAKIGENVQLRRLATIQSQHILSAYNHGGRIGVLVEIKQGNADLAKDIAMHIAASNPRYVKAEEVSKELIKSEREIFTAQAMQSGKPMEIIEKMVDGRIKKFLEETTLLGQAFVKDPDISVAQLLQREKAEVVQFIRYEVGEGIEKKAENFAEEVMAQVRGV